MDRITKQGPEVGLVAALLGAALVLMAADRAAAQTTPKVFFACYVPSTGTVYRIKEPDTPDACRSARHVEFSWTDGALPDGGLNIAGMWNYSDNLSSVQTGISCTASGTATINQTGTNFAGTITITSGVCTDPSGGTSDRTGTFNITGGQTSGNHVSFGTSFGASPCQFTGTITGSPPNQMSGTVTCTVPISGTNFTFTGTWQGNR